MSSQDHMDQSGVAPRSSAWRKSSRSGGGGCVEVRSTSTGVEVRDSKNISLPSIHVGQAAWSEFLLAIKAGEFDHHATR